MLQVFLARHGETDWNAAHRVQGSIDTDLNARGRAQAQALGEVLLLEHQASPFTSTVCSDMLRTRSTIAPFLRASGLSCDFSPWWRERGHGILEGLTQSEIQEQHPQLEALWKARKSGNWLPDGESLDGVAERIRAALRSMEERYVKARDADANHVERVLVVTHGGTLDAAYRYVANLPLDAPRTFTLGNCQLHALEFNGTQWQIRFWGEDAHLR